MVGMSLVWPAFRLLLVVVNAAFTNPDGSEMAGKYQQLVTPTPFLPLPVSNVFLPIVNQSINLIPENWTEMAFDHVVEGIHFEPGEQQITIKITPTGDRGNSSKPLEISFLPGEQCVFGDGQACIYTYLSSYGSQIILVSLHSGMGGEGEGFRDLIEGTGFNQGLYTAEQVSMNVQTFTGAGITLLQGDIVVNGYELMGIARIPPQRLATYLALPVEETLDFAVEHQLLDPETLKENLLVIETCGWRLPGESWAPGVSDTSGSIYLGLVRVADNYP